MMNRLLAASMLGVGLIAISACNWGSSESDEVVRYGAISSEVRGLDPMDIGDTTSSGMASNFYEPLYQYHYLKRPYVVIPLLASEMPQYSEDRMTVTIPIRKGIHFHDDPAFADGKGRELVAEDFVYSWKRIAYVKNVSKNWWILEDRIVGLDEFRESTKDVKKGEMDYRQAVDGLKAIGAHTLQLKLKRPWPALEYALAHLPLSAVPREAVEKYGEEFHNKAVGTGPFVLERWQRGSAISMVRNPNYHEQYYPTEGESGDRAAGLLDDAGKRLPMIDRAEFRVVKEDQPYWLLFQQGKLDLAGIPKDSFNQAINENRQLTAEMQSKGIYLSKFEEPTTFWLGFNMMDPVVGDNLPLRQAMNAAFNRDEFIRLFTNGRGKPAKGPIPPMFKEFNDELKSPYTTYDPQLAKQKLKEAERIHGGPIPKLVISLGGTDTTVRQMGQYWQRTFKAIGLEVEIELMTWPALQDKIKKQNAQIFQMGWIADWPDGENFMLLWYGKNVSPGANNTNYVNPKFDELYRRIAQMPFSEERVRLIQQMEQMVVDDLPNLFTTHRESYVLRYDWLKNYKPHVFGYGLMKYHKIDTELRGH